MIDWARIPRGRPVRGAHKLAEYIFDDENADSAVRGLDRSEFAIQILAGRLVGFSGWLDAALAHRAPALAGSERVAPAQQGRRSGRGRMRQENARSAGDGRAHSGRSTTSPTIAESPQSSTPDAVERHGNWLVIGRDTTRKRIVCKCVVCSHTCQIGAEALESAVVVCGGCVAPRNNPAPASQGRSSFAKEVADEAAWGSASGTGAEP